MSLDIRESYYRNVLAQSGVAQIITDRNLTIQFWNAASSKLFGAESSLMIGTKIDSIIPASQRKRVSELFLKSINENEIIDIEFRYEQHQGDFRELIMTISPVYDDEHELIGLSACVRDITKRIRLQEQQDENKKMVALGEMAGAVAHHFNNIIGGIITRVDFAVQTDSPSLKSKTLEKIGASLTKSTELLEGLLFFAEGNQRNLHYQDFSDIIQALVEEFDSESFEHPIDIVTCIPKMPALPVAMEQITAVLRNILRNAVEAMPGGGKIEITCELTANDIVVSVRDTGTGIHEDKINRIFEPFYSTKNVLQGKQGQAPGLGLAVAHGILQVMGGHIEVQSSLDEGSLFTVYFPRSHPANGDN